jgi:NAD(P)-dependent dehydrogenase (short-subunit alcohol dehydrogenase family)
VQTDVSVRAQVERLVQETVTRFSGVHILVNNAAKLGGNGHLLEMTQDEWDRTLAANLTGAFICAQLAAREMVRAGGGSIINVSSTNGLLPQPECGAYAASKGGLEMFTRVLAIDLAPYHIRANTIAPGPVQSRDPDDTPPRPNECNLAGRNGLPDEVAALACFLASDASSFINGERIAIDGGLVINAYRLYGVPMVRREFTW